MKLHKILLGCAAAMAMASCVSEDLQKGQTQDMGRLELGVETLQPMKTRADVYTVTNFPVTIYEADGITKVESYESSSTMPTPILLPVGTYVLEAHTPGIMERIMDAPYYIGRETSEIIKNGTTQSTITCKMANTSISVNFSQDFLDLFTEWTITFDDGTENAISFTNEEGNTPPTKYWVLSDNVEKINVGFKGKKADGSSVTATNTLTKLEATETYDGESMNFGGGDAVVVNVTPTDATSGLVNITITASIFGLDAEEVPAIIQFVDNGPLKPDDGEDPGTEPGDDNAIVLGLPAPITFTKGEGSTLDTSLGDTHIGATEGLKSLMVTAESDNPAMVASLEAVGSGYGLDFVNAGVEVVGNTDLVAFFKSLGKDLSVPAKGDTSYDFPIGNFFTLLDVMTGVHQFHLTAIDLKGNEKSGTVVVTVNKKQ